ncbi:MAG TPA: NAD(P)-dependent oxidoreductase [Thermoanaerobaculia bacterium]|jgi:nucleoside-diphosphate-sugar epimerase
MASPPRILITGAAGNLGSLLGRHLAARGHRLRLMHHRKPLPADLAAAANVEPVAADLARPETLSAAVADVDAIIHFAGVLFRPRPERFLPETNVRWFVNLLDAALAARVGRVTLASFPHVEGETSPEAPATGRLDRDPPSVHARTRLEAERTLFARTRDTATTPVALRLGMVYGRGVLMVEAAHWLARRRLLGVWRQPTWYQLLSLPDFLQAAEAALTKPGVEGIYHVGDEEPVTLQQFLDEACRVWKCPRPFRVPAWSVSAVAGLCELAAAATGKPAPFTRDFIRIGRVSHWGDTRRARAELLPTLRYRTLAEGLEIL